MHQLRRLVPGHGPHRARHPDGLGDTGPAVVDAHRLEARAGGGVERGVAAARVSQRQRTHRLVGRDLLQHVEAPGIEHLDAARIGQRQQRRGLERAPGKFARLDAVEDDLDGVCPEPGGHGHEAVARERVGDDLGFVLEQLGQQLRGRVAVFQLASVDDEALGPGQLDHVLDAHGQAIGEQLPVVLVEARHRAQRDRYQRRVGREQALDRRSRPEGERQHGIREGRGVGFVAEALRVEQRGVEAVQAPGRIGQVERVVILVDRQRLRRDGQLHHQLAGAQVVDTQPVAGGYVEPVAVAPVSVTGEAPARLDDRVLRRHAQVGRAGDLVAAGNADTPGHGVLGQVRMGELVDVVRLAVLPVLQELGCRTRVIDLVEVHPHRLVETEAAQRQGEHHEHDQHEQVQSIDAAAELEAQQRAAVAAQGAP